MGNGDWAEYPVVAMDRLCDLAGGASPSCFSRAGIVAGSGGAPGCRNGL